DAGLKRNEGHVRCIARNENLVVSKPNAESLADQPFYIHAKAVRSDYVDGFRVRAQPIVQRSYLCALSRGDQLAIQNIFDADAIARRQRIVPPDDDSPYIGVGQLQRVKVFALLQ